MKKCKMCKGTGMVFAPSSFIDTGKETRMFGYTMPVYTSGKVQANCSKCYGKGMK